MCVFLSHNVCLVECLSSNCGALLRLLLVPRMMMTASWPSKVFFTSSLFRTSPTTTLDALWSGGSLAGSRTSTVTLYPEEENETNQQQKQMFGKIKLVVCCIYNDMQPYVISGNMYQHNTVVLFPKFTRLLLYILQDLVTFSIEVMKSGRRSGRMMSVADMWPFQLVGNLCSHTVTWL